MSNQIKPCHLPDIFEVWEIVKSCSNWLASKGMNHWTKDYDVETIQQKFRETTVFGFLENNVINGVISLSTKPPIYYNKEDFSHFQDPNAKSFYVSMLAVRPELHRKGIASQLMTFVEETAGKYNIPFVRLMHMEPCEELNKFYTKRNYNLTHTRDDEENLMNFYEKKI